MGGRTQLSEDTIFVSDHLDLFHQVQEQNSLYPNLLHSSNIISYCGKRLLQIEFCMSEVQNLKANMCLQVSAVHHNRYVFTEFFLSAL